MQVDDGSSVMMCKYYTQQALLLLGFPLVRPWPELKIDPGPLDGRSLTFADDGEQRTLAAHARQLARSRGLRTLPDSYLVLIKPQDYADSGREILNALTVFAVSDREIIRFQPVIVYSRFLRAQGSCREGVLSEIDEPHLGAWDGTPMASTRRT